MGRGNPNFGKKAPIHVHPQGQSQMAGNPIGEPDPDDQPIRIPDPHNPGRILIIPPKNAILKRQAEIRFKEFIRQALKILDPGRKYKLNWLNDGMCDHFQAMAEGIAQNSREDGDPPYIQLDADFNLPVDPIRNLIENVPPRSLKSTIAAVLFPAWAWIHWPHLRFMFISYSQLISLRDSRRCRQIIESEWYQKNWGDKFQLSADSNTMIRYDNTQGGFRYAVSTQGQIMGEGADIIVCDDLDNTKEIHSKTARKKVHSIWDDVLPTRHNDPKTGCWVILAQRSHAEDITGYVINQDKDNPDVTWIKFVIQAEFEVNHRCITPIFRDPRTKEGELINPDRFGPKEIRILKRRLRTAFNIAAQLQQRPVPLEGGIFEHDWWQFYRWSELPPILSWTSSCISVDMNFGSKSDKASYCVFQAWARVGSKFYLLGQVRGQWKFSKAKRALIRFVQKYHFIYSIYIENKANGPAIISELQDTYGLAGIIPVDVNKEDGDKEARAEAISPLVEALNCYLPDPSQTGCGWVEDEFFPEVDVFPMASNDDQVDALSQALKRLRGNVAFGVGSDDLEFEDGTPIDDGFDSHNLGYGDAGFVGSTCGILGGMGGIAAGIGSGIPGGGETRVIKKVRAIQVKDKSFSNSEGADERPKVVISDEDLECLRALEFAAGPGDRVRDEVKGFKKNGKNGTNDANESDQKGTGFVEVGGAIGNPFEQVLNARCTKSSKPSATLVIEQEEKYVPDPFWGY